MIDVGAGVVDYDYRGPVGVVLFNHGAEDFKVSKGDRVAQLILERICMADIEEVSVTHWWPESRLNGCTVAGEKHACRLFLLGPPEVVQSK